MQSRIEAITLARRCQALVRGFVVASLVSCASPAEDAVRIGVIAPFGSSPTTANGARLAATEINAAGGILIDGRRRPIELLVEDSERSPETSVRKALELINRHGVVAIVGVPLSRNAIPVAQVAENARIPFVTTQSTHPQTTAGKSFTFRLSVLDSTQGRAMARFVYEHLGMRRAAVLAEASSPYSAGLAEIFSAAFGELGGQVEALRTFTSDRPQVAQALAEIAATEPEALYLPVEVALVAPFLSEARAAGLRAVFVGSDSWSDVADYPSEAGVSYFTDVWAPDRGGAKVARFLEAHRRALGTEPSTSAALAYEAVTVVAAALEGRREVDPEAIRDALAGLAFEGVSGPLRFDGSGNARRAVIVRQIDPRGRMSFHREIEP